MVLTGLKKIWKFNKKSLTFGCHNVIIFMVAKMKGGKMANKKLGRPTDNPKNIRLAVRMDKETFEILDKYCQKENISKMEGIRRGIRKLDK